MTMRGVGIVSARVGRIGAGVAAAALLFSACSAGDSGSETPAEGSLVIGALINISGPTTTGEENAPDVLKGWAKNINKSGGLNGRKVAFDIVDTKGDAPKATAAVTRWSSDKSIVAVVLYDASTEGAVAEAVTAAGLPVIGGIGYNPTAWGKLPNWLPIATTFPAVINMGMRIGKEGGATKTVFPVCAENSSCAAAGPLAESASKALGMSFAGVLPVSVSAPDYTAECLKIKNDGVDFVMLGLTTAASLRLVQTCKTQGYAGQWGLFDGSVWPKVMKQNDPGVKIGIALSAFPWYVDDKPVADYRNQMNQAGVPADSWASPQGTAAYATMELFKKAITTSGLPETVTRADVVKAYGSIRGETLGGLLPQPITFKPGQPQALVNCFWLASYERGKFSGTELSKPTCDTINS
jgi:branched-chain amino acid transport system substrate-binding protein